MERVYIALFSCCTTRAIHLELVKDLMAHTFLKALRRFTARRGTPSLIVSDNAKTFKSAIKVIKRVFKNETVQAELRNKRIEWKFNLGHSRWWGGFFERMVGSVKRVLRKVLRNARLDFDKIHTFVVETEGILNSRPLTYFYEDGDNAEVLLLHI